MSINITITEVRHLGWTLCQKRNAKDKDIKPKKVWNIQEEQSWDKYNEELLWNIDKVDKTTIDTFSDSLIGIINASMEKHISKV